MTVRIEVDARESHIVRAVAERLREHGVEPGGDGAAAFDPEARYRELDRMFSDYRITLPPDYRFDRNEIHDRHG